MAGKVLKLVRDNEYDRMPSKGDYGKEDGSTFGWFDRLMFGYRDGLIFDYGDWEARDLYEMMQKDYKARQLENVLALPVLSAERSIIPGKGNQASQITEWLTNYWETDPLNGGCKDPLHMIVDRMTTGITYKRAYFEKVWVKGTGDFQGKVVYDKVAWRPQTTCRLMRHPKHGGFAGFEQEAYYVGPEITKGHWPIKVPAKRAFVYIHGTRRDPLSGTSDMEIAYWSWKTKQKILFLWFQFLENVSLPRTVVQANDIAVANQVARQIAKLKSSGVIPVAVPNGVDSVGISQLDVSGKGAEQFMQAIQWLDNAGTSAVLAGFLNLTDVNMSGGTGSYALSKDASDFFLQMEEAKAREMEYSVRNDLFAPLVRANFGPTAAIPYYKFEPLNDVDKATAVQLLQSVLAMPPGGTNPVPADFVAQLAGQVANYLGLDATQVHDAFQAASAEAAKAAAAQSAAAAAPLGQNVAGVAGAVGAAAEAMRTGQVPAGKKIKSAQPAPPAKKAIAAAKKTVAKKTVAVKP